MAPSMRIALVSDFFCPNAGGIETHIYFLAQCLLAAGHKVVVLTHNYGRRRGIRFLSNDLKVYYIPLLSLYSGSTVSAIMAEMPWYRWIFLRERIQIVHGHSTFSPMAHEAIFHGWQMGLRTVFTDHSLFGFADASAILVNTLLLQYSLAPANKAICVSYTSKENTVLRGKIDPDMVSTIPNAIETQLFQPDSHQFYSNPTTIVFLGRLVYRKGADLLCDVIPRICAKYPNVHFVIGGDGPKRVEIEQMLERADLQLRVRMLGMLPHDRVRDILVQGQIFVNTSLTEAFCTSIVEAAACGLHVVSTRVGGVPEVLPPHYITLSEPNPRWRSASMSLFCGYVWKDVTERTIAVYESALAQPPIGLKEGLRRYCSAGIGFGLMWIVAACINWCLLVFMEWMRPAKDVPTAEGDWERRVVQKRKRRLGHDLPPEDFSLPPLPDLPAQRPSVALEGQSAARRRKAS